LLASEENGDTINSLSFSHARDIIELIVLTTDELFLQTLREAGGGARRLWHVGSPDQVSNLLVAGEVGILVLDTQSVQSAAGTFLTQIKRQFPDLVLIVAGSREDEASLANLISTGVIYRFIHKPMSPGRAKLFADAAVRKYVEQRARTPAAVRTPHPVAANPAVVRGAAIGALCLVFAVAVTWALWHRRAAQDSVPLPATEVAANQPGSRGPVGNAEVRDRLLGAAESALLEERLDDAAAAIDAGRKAGVENARLAFLSAQLAKSRERHASVNQSRSKAESRADAQSLPDERLTRSLRLAAERMQSGRLIDPQKDNARYYVTEALKIDPNTNATQAAKQSLALLLLSEAHASMERRDFPHATALLDAAGGIAAPSNIDSLRQQLTSSRKQVDAEAAEKLLKTGLDRLQQDQLIEPPNDNAKYYLSRLHAVNPSYPGLDDAQHELGSRLVAQARRAITLKQPDAARAWLDEASTLGYSSAEATAVLRDLETPENPPSAPVPTPIAAGQLNLVSKVAPTYPRKAEADHTDGWVELDFTVAETGEVKDIVVHAAKPAGVFDQAAIGALAQWRYQPIMQDSKPVARRARIRMRFKLPD
jgi:TonB family protein